jgi:hypothetical protein
MILFDLKHNFFHLYTLYQYYLDIQAHRVSGFYTYYQFLNIWPLLAIIGGFVLTILFKKSKLIVAALLVGFLFSNLSSPYSRLFTGTITPNDITLKNIDQVAQTIAIDKPPAKYNIAVLLDFDTRAHPLRYLLTYRYNIKPQAVENYNDIDALYVLSPNDYDMELPKVWELQTYLPYKITLMDHPTANHLLYKLTK